MKKEIKIVGVIDEENGELKLSNNGLNVPLLAMTITALTKMLFDDMDEEDHETMKELLRDIAEDPEEELKKQFEAIRISRLLKSLKKLCELDFEDDEDEPLN